MITTRIRRGAAARVRLATAMLMGALLGGSARAREPGPGDETAVGTEVDEPAPEAWRPPWLGVPGGLTFDAHRNAETDETFFFVRFAEPRSGRVVVTLHDARGDAVARLSAELEHGSAMLLWDGTTSDGERAGAGTLTVGLDAGDVQAGVALVRP